MKSQRRDGSGTINRWRFVAGGRLGRSEPLRLAGVLGWREENMHDDHAPAFVRTGTTFASWRSPKRCAGRVRDPAPSGRFHGRRASSHVRPTASSRYPPSCSTRSPPSSAMHLCCRRRQFREPRSTLTTPEDCGLSGRHQRLGAARGTGRSTLPPSLRAAPSRYWRKRASTLPARISWSSGTLPLCTRKSCAEELSIQQSSLSKPVTRWLAFRPAPILFSSKDSS